MISLSRRHAAVVAGALAALLTLSASAVAASARAPGTLKRDVTITQLAEYSGAPEAREIAIDSPARRAYLMEGFGNTAKVRVLDLTGAELGNVTTIGGFQSPSVMAVDEKSHQLFVVDATATNRVVIIDVNPASPTAYGVVGSVDTTGAGAARIDVDSDAHVVYVTHSTSRSISVIDVATLRSREVALSASPTDVTVDSENHRAYVGATNSSITVISGSTVSASTIDRIPTRLQMVAGQLLAFVLDPTGGGSRLELLQPTTLATVKVSEKIAALPNSLEVDEARHLIYLASNALGAQGVTVLSSGSLATLAFASNGNNVSGAVDNFSHDLLTLDSSRSPLRVMRSVVRQTPPSEVHRIGGADRFAVSARVSAESFEPDVSVVYVASGAVFADALSGSAAAGVAGGPVLLVLRDSVPDAVSAELIRLKPKRIVILGGTASVGAGVEAQLGSYAGAVSRVAGADRFEVSAGVSAAAFSAGAPVAYVASGEVFSDALSGSAAAGQESGPVLLVPKGSVPPAVEAELRRLHPGRIVVLGGETTVDPSVASALGAIAPVSRIAGRDRFVVSANVSGEHFFQGVDTVYVASGAVFPDALSGSAAAIAAGAPVLLVGTDSIPGSIDAELKRLAPYRIVVLGGSNTVSDAVLSQLQSYLPQ
jgi:putative cell wall-binding protein